MGMPICVQIDDSDDLSLFDKVYDYFDYVDKKFSTYKPDSEINAINNKMLLLNQASSDMQLIFKLAEQTKLETDGYFDIFNGKTFDPSGIVKGWAINNAAKLLKQLGSNIFYVDAGGDIQTSGRLWTIGIRHPFQTNKIVKSLNIDNLAVATSGIYERGNHVYNPKKPTETNDLVSLTVIGPNIYEADRFATAAFAMGKQGILFIDSLPGFSGMAIDHAGLATFTRDFKQYVAN